MVNHRTGLCFDRSWRSCSPWASSRKKKDEKKESEDQKRETQAVIKIVDDVAAGTACTERLSLRHGNMKRFHEGAGQQAIHALHRDNRSGKGDCTKRNGHLLLACRRRRMPPPPPPPAPDPKDAKKDDKDKKNGNGSARNSPTRTEVSLPLSGQSAPMRITRSLTVPGRQLRCLCRGEGSDVAAEERPGSESIGDQTEPDGARFLERRVDCKLSDRRPANRAVGGAVDSQQQIERPYAPGSLEIVPVTELKFRQQSGFRPSC